VPSQSRLKNKIDFLSICRFHLHETFTALPLFLLPNNMRQVSSFGDRQSQRRIDLRCSLAKQNSKPLRRQRSLVNGDDVALSELAIPQPAEKSEDETPDTYEREEQSARRNSTHWSVDEDAELTELAVPAPILRRGSGEEEAAGVGFTDTSQFQDLSNSQVSSSSQAEKEKSPKRQKTIIPYTEVCAISWIIFFSILGTLARLGVQAMSTYPYSVFPSPVLWANLGGSMFLGFLLEDRAFVRYTVDI
jgi:hypothetical protein